MTQIIIAQKFVNMSGKPGDNLSEAIMSAVIGAQKEVEKTGMKGVTVIVRQVMITGIDFLKLTIIMDIVQTISSETSDVKN